VQATETLRPTFSNCVSLYHLLVDNVKSKTVEYNPRRLASHRHRAVLGAVCDGRQQDVRVTVRAAARMWRLPVDLGDDGDHGPCQC
jgi:hypothetical protein